MSGAEYLANEQERQRQQMAQAMQRRAMQQDQQNTDRELSLKELLANHQMAQDQAASALARDRLGLDSNIASADANQRAKTLSSQERLGWAGENRMSRGQDQDEAFRRAQLGQQAELAQLPYQQRTADSVAQSDFNDRQLAQQDRQFNTLRPGEMLSHILGLKELASREAMHDRPSGAATLTARLQQWLNQNPSAEAVMRDARTGQEITQRGDIAKMENTTRRDLGFAPWTMGPTSDTQATLAQRWREFTNRSADSMAADTQRAADRDLQRWQHGTESGSAKAARESQREMFDANQLSDDWWRANQFTQSDLDRASREKLAGNENDVRKLGVLAQLFDRGTVPLDQDFQEGLVGALRDVFPQLRNSPIANPQERTTRTMLDNLRATTLPDGKAPATPEELHQSNWEAAKQIDAAQQAGHFKDATAQKWLQAQDQKTPNGVGSISQMLKYIEAQRQAEAERRKAYSNSGFIWTGQ